ncbi:hypothetical protein JOD43_004166 [Pullulanibacillus pueri]|uniref:Uncharacterized protein n=1 Tax=Pullulanibacillus pueri TaxID=1437324 RepID=A0A8J2ZZE0_9BACL|nr:hypothetical protein [Pullulanibacillus pueri]GGH88114.1 hypothetical protein GCM10007096_39710 [Pullulanibacillus pueri]
MGLFLWQTSEKFHNRESMKNTIIFESEKHLLIIFYSFEGNKSIYSG